MPNCRSPALTLFACVCLVLAAAAVGCVVDFAEDNCGNAVIDQGEQCDGQNLAGLACTALGFESGQLSCADDCSLNLTACVNGCGNGIQEYGEVCDGADTADHTCESLGLFGGLLVCRTDCSDFDTSGCFGAGTCGDGIVNGSEECDGADLGGQTCQTLNFTGGTLGCDSFCRFDVAGCTGTGDCGNGVIDPGEQCDGNNLGGMTCADMGFVDGTLTCYPDCGGFDPSGCTRPDFSPCESDQQCASGLCLSEVAWGFPSGMCTRVCNGDNCDTGDVCVLLDNAISVCLPGCTDTSGCRNGYACFNWDASGLACRPHCETLADCPLTQLCNRWKGLCGITPTASGNGQSCIVRDDCESGFCMDVWSNGSLYCISWCNVNTGICPEDGICSDMYASPGDHGVCLDGCDIDEDCAQTGFTCVDNPWGGGRVCETH